MSKERDKETLGILVRSVDYGGADRVVTFLTPGNPGLALFARGARKSTRRFSGGLEPFRITTIRYRPKAQDGLGRLIKTTIDEEFEQVTQDLCRLYWASIGLEWAVSVGPDPETSHVFYLTREYLRWINTEEREQWYIEAGSLRYALILLFGAGLLPTLTQCFRSGRPLHQIEHPHFSTTGGGILDAAHVQPQDYATPVHKKTALFLESLAQSRFPEHREPEILREAREIVLQLYRSLVDHTPRSLELLRSVWI